MSQAGVTNDFVYAQPGRPLKRAPPPRPAQTTSAPEVERSPFGPGNQNVTLVHWEGRRPIGCRQCPRPKGLEGNRVPAQGLRSQREADTLAGKSFLFHFIGRIGPKPSL